MTPHPLLAVLHAASRGLFPADDGGFTVMPPLDDGRAAVVCLTGHAFVCADVTREWLSARGCDGFGRALAPHLLLDLAGADGRVHEVDATLAATGQGSMPAAMPPRIDAADHPRVAYAASLRRAVRVHGDVRGLVTLAKGLAGRDEISIEAPSSAHNSGAGRSLLADVLTAWPAEMPLFAAVSPGNARSLRAFLAAGFRPIGSEVLIDTGHREARCPP